MRKTPTHCGQPMQMASMRDPDRGEYYHRSVWQCGVCGKLRELYPAPWRWFWVAVHRNHLEDEFMRPGWWMGAVGALHDWTAGLVTFTVMPFNIIVDLVVRGWQWCRYRKPTRLALELEKAYRRGHVDGRARARALIRNRLQRLDEAALVAGCLWPDIAAANDIRRATELVDSSIGEDVD